MVCTIGSYLEAFLWGVGFGALVVTAAAVWWLKRKKAI